MLKHLLTLVGGLLIVGHVSAQGLSLQGITDSQLEGVVSDLSSVFMHSQSGPASPLGTVFGFELGGYYNTTDISALNSVNQSSTASSSFPFVGVILGASFPMGITAEMNYFPQVSNDGLSIDISSFAGKWTLPDAFIPLPGSYAAKVFYSSAKIAYTDVALAGANIDLSTDITGLQFIGSMSFGIIEPYATLGYLMSTGKLSSTVPGVFADSSTSKSSSPTSMQFAVGAELNLLVMALGLEYSNAFDTSKTSFKFSFQF